MKQEKTSTPQYSTSEAPDLASLVFSLRSDPIIKYLSESRTKPLTNQCIKGLLATNDIDYLSNRIFCADEKLFEKLSTTFKARSTIFEGAGEILSSGKAVGDHASALQAAKLLSAFYQRGVDVESKRVEPLTAQTILFTLQKHYPSEGVSFALEALHAGCKLRDGVLSHTLIEGEKVVKTFEDLKHLVQFAQAAFRNNRLTNSPYATTFQTLLSKISSPHPIEKRVSAFYPPNETLLQVGERLLLAHELGMACIDANQGMENKKNSLILNNLVRSLANYPIAVNVEQTKYTHPRKYHGYLSISEKLGIDFKRNVDPQEALFSEDASRIQSDVLRAGFRLANGCFRFIPADDTGEAYYSLDYTLHGTSINQLLVAVHFTNFTPDSQDCEEIQRLLTAALLTPETREKLHSEYISDAILSILNSSEIPAKLRTASALQLAALAAKVRRGPNDVRFFTSIRDEFLAHHPRERAPVIGRDAEHSYQRDPEHIRALRIVQQEIGRYTRVAPSSGFLKGGIG